MKKINTIEKLFEFYGGYRKIARLLGLGHTAVHNWKAAGVVSQYQSLRMYLMTKERGGDISLDLLGLTESDFLPEPDRQGEAA